MTESKRQALGLDTPLDEDEVLIHRFLDGDLPPEEEAAFEARLEREPEFRTLYEETSALFNLLESSALARSALLWAPENKPHLSPTVDLVENAIERWKTGQREDDGTDEL